MQNQYMIIFTWSDGIKFWTLKDPVENTKNEKKNQPKADKKIALHT